MSSTTLKPKKHTTPRKTKTQQRTCRHPGCGKRLSMYNPHEFCFLHFRQLVSADYRYL
ncbi:MAG: hypothetical protein KC900_01865 [Candidatus Omnitrophica bacterium]|nr:hypothetical protein [Candidatus Omnitrophota bacterium]